MKLVVRVVVSKSKLLQETTNAAHSVLVNVRAQLKDRLEGFKNQLLVQNVDIHVVYSLNSGSLRRHEKLAKRQNCSRPV